METITKLPGTCAICEDPASYKCGSCRAITYCSKAHWRHHWKEHQKVCKIFEIHQSSANSDDDVFPRYCIATRDLKAGSIILEEPSIFHFPITSSSALRNEASAKDTFCVGCGNGMNLNTVTVKGSDTGAGTWGEVPVLNKCSLCKWPVCSQECEKLAIHAENECKIFSKCKIVPDSILKKPKLVTPGHWTEIIKIIRVVGLNKNHPQMWKILTGIETPNLCSYDENSQVETVAAEVIGVLIDIFTGSKLNSYVDLLFGYLTMEKVLRSQGFKHQCGPQGGKRFPDKFATYMYYTASNFSHDCRPNCTWNIGPAPDFKIRISAAVLIKRGERLSVSRIQNESKSRYGTLVRQHLLITRLGFQCKCKMCLDPTEIGSYMSALICPTCRKNGHKGYLLPVPIPVNLNQNNTQVDDDEENWKCDWCEGRTSVSGNLDKLLQVTDKLDSQSKIEIESRGTSKKIGKLCSSIIDKYRDVFLHPNHWIIQYASRTWSNSLMHSSMITAASSDGPMSDTNLVLVRDDIVQMTQLNRYLQSVLDKTTPGICIQQAYLLVELSYGLESSLLLEMQFLDGLSGDRINTLIASQLGCVRMRERLYRYFKSLFPPKDCKEGWFLYPLYYQIQQSKQLLKILESRLVTSETTG